MARSASREALSYGLWGLGFLGNLLIGRAFLWLWASYVLEGEPAKRIIRFMSLRPLVDVDLGKGGPGRFQAFKQFVGLAGDEVESEDC